jgi:hypothetical protein
VREKAVGKGGEACPRGVSGRLRRICVNPNDLSIFQQLQVGLKIALNRTEMSRTALLLVLSLSGCALQAATLEKLTLDEMVARSTAIVRARAVTASALWIGPTIYTRTHFQVLETWKGPNAAAVDVTEPGGSIGSAAQEYSGVPHFTPGQEFVLFLWTGPSGRTQVIGLSQGIFSVERPSGGAATVRRKPSGGLMLAPGAGAPVTDEEVVMPLSSLAAHVHAALTPK